MHQFPKEIPCTSAPEVRSLLHGMARAIGVGHEGKASITIEMMEDFLEYTRKLPRLDLQMLSDLAMLSLSFVCLLRRSELIRMKTKNIEIRPDGSMSVKIRKSKTDQQGQGKILVIDEGSPLEIIENLRKYKHRAKVKPDQRLFRQISTSVRKGTHLTKRKLSNTSVRKLTLRFCEILNLDKTKYSMHSFRHGGATYLASQGMAERTLQRWGRWKTATACRIYVDESIDSGINVSTFFPTPPPIEFTSSDTD